MHLTPADYIRKRRLSEIALEISLGDRPISDIAFEYGFNSKENFTRAFKSEHHVLPTEYKSVQNSLKLYGNPLFDNTEFSINPEITELSDFDIMAYQSDEEHTPNFWNKYNCQKLSLQLSGGIICEDYGICTWNPPKNKLDYFIGIRKENIIQSKDFMMENIIEINIKGGLYAIFDTPTATHFNFVNTIHQTWNYILNVWMPKSNYKCAEYADGYKYQFETYVESSRSFSEKIYIPIEQKRK